jgi:hypothetical protein
LGCCAFVVFWKFIALMMEAETTFETSANFYYATRRTIPEDSDPQQRLIFFLRLEGHFLNGYYA